MKTSENLVALTNVCADPQNWHHGGGIGSPGKPYAQCVLGHLGDLIGIPRLHVDGANDPECIDYLALSEADEVEVLYATMPLPDKKNGPFQARSDRIAANNDAISHPELMEWLYRATALSKELEQEHEV